MRAYNNIASYMLINESVMFFIVSPILIGGYNLETELWGIFAKRNLNWGETSLSALEVNGLWQNCSISIANILEILQSCTKPSKGSFFFLFHHDTQHQVTTLIPTLNTHYNKYLIQDTKQTMGCLNNFLLHIMPILLPLTTRNPKSQD